MNPLNEITNCASSYSSEYSSDPLYPPAHTGPVLSITAEMSQSKKLSLNHLTDSFEMPKDYEPGVEADPFIMENSISSPSTLPISDFESQTEKFSPVLPNELLSEKGDNLFCAASPEHAPEVADSVSTSGSSTSSVSISTNLNLTKNLKAQKTQKNTTTTTTSSSSSSSSSSSFVPPASSNNFNSFFPTVPSISDALKKAQDQYESESASRPANTITPNMDTVENSISDATSKKFYADQAAKRANQNPKAGFETLPKPTIKRPIFETFQTEFEWARIYDSENFPFDDVLLELIALRKLDVPHYSFKDPTFGGCDEKINSAYTIIAMDKFYESYTPKQIRSEGRRLKTTDLSQKDYIDFIIHCTQETDVFAIVDIPRSVFQQSSLATHKAYIIRSVKSLASTNLALYTNKARDLPLFTFLKEICENIERHIVIKNERIVIKRSIFDGGRVYEPSGQNASEIFFTFLIDHLVVKLPEEEYRPQISMSMLDQNMVPYLMELKIKSLQAVSAEAILFLTLRDLEIKPECFYLTKKIKPRSHPNPQVAELNVDKYYAYLYLSPNQSVPIINCEIILTNLITYRSHCTACGSNSHARYSCTKARCVICKKDNHVASVCYYNKKLNRT